MPYLAALQSARRAKVVLKLNTPTSHLADASQPLIRRGGSDVLPELVALREICARVGRLRQWIHESDVVLRANGVHLGIRRRRTEV